MFDETKEHAESKQRMKDRSLVNYDDDAESFKKSKMYKHCVNDNPDTSLH